MSHSHLFHRDEISFGIFAVLIHDIDSVELTPEFRHQYVVTLLTSEFNLSCFYSLYFVNFLTGTNAR